MQRSARSGAVLALGLAVVVATAVLPAGLDGRPVSAIAWTWWGLVSAGALVALGRASGSTARAVRNLALLVPAVLVLTLPATAFAAAGRGVVVAFALIVRALAASAASLATMVALGPSGVVAGLAALRVPRRLVEIVHAMLVSMAAIVRQISGMQRARAARRAGPAPWAALAVAPLETLRGFGRLVGTLLLRSVERAEALERARRARGGTAG